MLAALGALVLLAGCKSNERETPSGLKYTVIEAGTGEIAKTGEIIIFDWQLKDSQDSTWQETFEKGIPAAAQIADSSQLMNEDGLTQMLRELSVGDSVRAQMPVVDYFGMGGGRVPPEMDTTLSLGFTIKVRTIVTEEGFQSYMDEEMGKREMRTHNIEAREISDYLAEKSLQATSDTSGVRYVIHNNGGGQKPTLDDCVEVKYKGVFMKTGQVFQEADRVAFPLSGVIPGWKIAVAMLGKGDSGTFYIPSKLAYGPRGYPPAIPPDAVLIFDVTLLDVKGEYDNTTQSCK